MAISQQDIQARIAQIQAQGGGDTAATRAQIAQEAQQYSVTPEQIGAATNLTGTQVRQMAQEAGQAFEPLKLAGGTPSPQTPTITPDTGGIGMISGATQATALPDFQPYQFQMDADTWTKASSGDPEALTGMLFTLGTSGQDVTGFRPYLEDIVTSATGDQGTDPAYNYLVGSAGQAIMQNDYNKAVESGDTQKAMELQTALSGGLESSWEYYKTNYPENSAHETVQQLFNDPFSIGAPGKYQKSFWDNIGDAISDVVQNPALQGIVTLAFPQAGAVMNLWGTLDSGKNASPAQWAAAFAGISKMSGLEGGNLIKQLPESWQEFATATKNLVEGKGKQFYDAWNRAFPDATTEQLAAVEDGIKLFFGEENIQTFSEGLAGIEDGLKSLTDIDLSGLGDFLTQEDLTAALAGIQTGGGFTAPRGYQPGLPVDVDFQQPEQSLALQILNQPSSVKIA